MELKGNQAQEDAINTIYGPMIVVSCPGSGKTTTLVRRIHKMVESGIPAASILMVTFANAAAKDMARKYVEMYGTNPGVTFATIHSLCFNILKDDGGFTADSLISEREKMDYFLWRVRNLPGIADPWAVTRDMILEISKVKNMCIPLKDYEPSCCAKEYFDKLFTQYEEDNSEAGRIDFDDMLLKCRDLLQEDPRVLAKWKGRFRHIQCDEYQDTNAIQKDILYMLAGEEANLCVVGDDDQSIYRFRGSDSRIMLGFADDFKKRGAKTVMMSTNYRCAGNIVDMADACIGFNNKRFKKDFISERGKNGEKGTALYKQMASGMSQMQDVVSTIKRLHEAGTPYEEMAILFRNNKQAVLPVQMLSAAGIPFYSTETVKSMYDEWMFEDIRSYAELSMGENTERNIQRILNRPNRYLKGKAFADAPYTTQGMVNAISYIKESGAPEWQFTQAQKSIFDWITAFGPGKVTSNTRPADLFDRLTGKKKSVHYDKYISQAAKFMRQDEGDLMDQFNLLKEDAMQYKTVGEWFAHAATVSRLMRMENEKRKSRNGICITTMHKSKGREWKAVFVIGVNDGILPGRECNTVDDLEEERRLLYVAMTRAKDYLCVYCSGRESGLMKQTMAALKEKKEPKIPKKLAGSPVMHKTYGKGRVQGYSGKHISIRFEDGVVRKYQFPDAFRKGYLEYI